MTNAMNILKVRDDFKVLKFIEEKKKDLLDSMIQVQNQHGSKIKFSDI